MDIYAASYLLPIASPPIIGGAVAVHDGKIVAVGTLAEVTAVCPGPVRDYPGCVLMPGLVNAHTHLELTHFPAWKMRKDLDYSPRTYTDWIIQVIKIKRGLTTAELEHSIREGMRIVLESGTTTIGEILSCFDLLPFYGHSPLSGRIFLELIGHNAQQYGVLLERVEGLLGSFPAGHFVPALSPHGPHTVADGLAQAAVRLAERQALPVAIHCAESPEEADFCFDSSGSFAKLLYPYAGWEDYLPAPRRISPVAWLDGLALLSPATSLIHCVHVTPADTEIMKQRGVTVVLCPRSNDRLNVGQAPVHLFRRSGIPLAIGTDSLASNDSLSLWDELSFLLDTFPEFSPEEAIYMATLGGATALGQARDCGSLEMGKRASFIVVCPEHLGVVRTLHENLLTGQHCVAVFVDGLPVYSETGAANQE